jgi:YbbR domain-containing protein
MQRLQRNWLWKLMSLALAFSLYAFVRSQESVDRRELSVRLALTVPPGQELVEPATPPMARVVLTGPAEEIAALPAGAITASVPLEGYRSGERQRLPVSVKLPPEVDEKAVQVAVFPGWVEVLTEPHLSRAVQLEIDGDVPLPEGWDWVEPPRAEPPVKTVTVSGLKPEVDKVVRTVAVMREPGPQEVVVAQAQVRAEDRFHNEVVGGVTLDPPQITLQARLKRRFWQKLVYVQPVFAAPPGVRLRVTVDPKRVRVYGSDRGLQDLHFIETSEVSLPLGQARVSQDVTLDMTAGITRIEPPSVHITIEQIDAAEGR